MDELFVGQVNAIEMVQDTHDTPAAAEQLAEVG